MSEGVYTEDEVRDQFIEYVWSTARYWAGLDGSNVSRDYDALARLSGFAHSFLAMLDGCDMSLPGFKVIPCPHPDDEAYHRDEGERWYPNDVDIAGGLHELLYSDRLRRDREAIRETNGELARLREENERLRRRVEILQEGLRAISQIGGPE